MRCWLTGGALCASMLMCVAGNAQERAPTMLAIFAHPDDELVVAPALADAAADGVEVTVIYATSGDAGPGVSDFEKGAELAAAREAEALCSSRALGLKEPVFLGYGDGTLWEQAQSKDGAASPLEAELSALIESYGPASIITWGPDGGYGHADHRMVSALVTEIVQRIDHDPTAPLVLFPAIANGTLPPVPEMQRWATTDPKLINARAEYDEAELARAAEAAKCHATQFDDATRAGMVPLFDQSIWAGAVKFRRAFP